VTYKVKDIAEVRNHETIPLDMLPSIVPYCKVVAFSGEIPLDKVKEMCSVFHWYYDVNAWIAYNNRCRDNTLQITHKYPLGEYDETRTSSYEEIRDLYINSALDDSTCE
jgi:hypothetical protein